MGPVQKPKGSWIPYQPTDEKPRICQRKASTFSEEGKHLPDLALSRAFSLPQFLCPRNWKFRSQPLVHLSHLQEERSDKPLDATQEESVL